jgi:hypothetical protein
MVKKLLKEPLLHFLLIGAALFGINAIHSGKESDLNEIVVDTAIINKIKLQYKQFTGMDATKAEVDSFISNYISEEIQYREALKAGLDKSDETRTSLIKQMNAASKEMITVAEPSMQQLESFYASNQSMFAYLDSNGTSHLPNFTNVVPIVKGKFIETEKEKQLRQKQQALRTKYKVTNQYKQP